MGQRVYVLVKTVGKEPRTPVYEGPADSYVIGVYTTFRQAKKALDEETNGMEAFDDDGEVYNSISNPSDWGYMTFVIHDEIIQDNDDEDSSEADY